MDTAVKEHSEVYGIEKGYRVNIERIDCYYKGQKRDIELDIVMGYCKGTCGSYGMA